MIQPQFDPLTTDVYGDERHPGDSSETFGQLQYNLHYDFHAAQLNVTVLQAVGLPAMDNNGSSDPFVKLFLSPDKSPTFESKVMKQTLAPVFNEAFHFQIAYPDLLTRTLVFELLDFDRFSRDDIIGEVEVPLGKIDFRTLKHPLEEWRDIKNAKLVASHLIQRYCQHYYIISLNNEKSQLGELCFSLRWVPTAGKLTVNIIEARDLKRMDLGGYSDPYVKLSLYAGNKRLKKKKTQIRKRTLNPYFNEVFTFQVPLDSIQKVALVLTVIDYDRLGSSEPIGRLILGSNSKGTQLKHWCDMVASPRRQITQWHTLQDPYGATDQSAIAAGTGTGGGGSTSSPGTDKK